MKITLASFFRPVALLAALSVTVVPTLRAHAVWIEDTPEKQLVIRFGEPGEAFEKSPGYLDNLIATSAWTFDADAKPEVFKVEKKSDHFLCVGAKPTQEAFGETGYPVMGKEGKPGTKPFFHLRWLPAGASGVAKPALTLDIVPTAEKGVFSVVFRGQPLADNEVVVHAPGEKEQEIKTDAQGLFRLTASKSGLYLITTNHREDIGGFATGKAYERTSYNASLAWRQP